MPKSKLRPVEKLVLSHLELNARTNLAKVGKKIKKSQQQVHYTVNALVDKHIIQNFYTLIDYSKLNVLNFRVYFKVSYFNKEKFEELITYLIKDPHTSWIATCGGGYDLICTFFTSNPSQFNKTLKSIIEKFPKQLQNYVVLTTIVGRWFGRKYLFKRFSGIDQIFFGGDREPEQIDNIDMHILQDLSQEARTTAVDLAAKHKITSKTILQRIKKLQEKEIILGFKPLINPGSIDYTATLLLIHYHNVSLKMENKLIDYLKAHPNVVSIVKTLGQWDIEIEIHTSSPLEFRKVEMDIRQKFTLLIQQIESVPLHITYKKNYFPGFLLGN